MSRHVITIFFFNIPMCHHPFLCRINITLASKQQAQTVDCLGLAPLQNCRNVNGSRWKKNAVSILFSLRWNCEFYAELETASFFKWSMKTCRLTSSVRIGAPVSYWNKGGAKWWFTHFANTSHHDITLTTLMSKMPRFEDWLMQDHALVIILFSDFRRFSPFLAVFVQSTSLTWEIRD